MYLGTVPDLKFFVLFDLILYVSSTIFSYVGTGLPGLNQYLARINVSCSRTCSENDFNALIAGA